MVTALPPDKIPLVTTYSVLAPVSALDGITKFAFSIVFPVKIPIVLKFEVRPKKMWCVVLLRIATIGKLLAS